jgi:transcriptional regulator with XRE-family HTH domain
LISNMPDRPPPLDPAVDLNQRIADRVRSLRTARRWTLEALAEKSGVSRSMISLVERGESSPTAVLLDRLSAALGVPLASLFADPAPTPQPLSPRSSQLTWRDPATGYLRRNVSPPGAASPIQLVEVELPAGARVAFESGSRDVAVHQQVWVQHGRIEVIVGDAGYALDKGDCLAFLLDRPTTFHNPTAHTARYAVVIVSRRAGSSMSGAEIPTEE